MSPPLWTTMMQGKPILALWPAFPQACFHPHPSMRGQMEIWITSGRHCQVYPLREGLLREGHLFYLFPAPWNLWNELRRFSETFGSVCLWTEAWPTSIIQGCCVGCWPQAQSTADFGDMMVILWHTNIFLWASPLPPFLFYDGQTLWSSLGKKQVYCAAASHKFTVFSVKTVGLRS